MELMDEVKEHSYDLISTNTIVYFKEIRYNSGAPKIAHLPKICPCTKEINVIYHHFRKYVRLGMINIYLISTHDQVANMFTKTLTQNNFLKHRVNICGS